MSAAATGQRSGMLTLLRLSRAEAVALIAIFLGVHAALAVANLGLLRSEWPTFMALGLVALAALALLATRADPLPLPVAGLVAGVAPTTAVLISWQLPNDGWPGYAAWHIGASAMLLSAVAVRGRISHAWLGYAALSGVTLAWAGSTASLGVGMALVGSHALTVALATFLGLMLVRLARASGEQVRKHARRAADEAATWARLHERDRRLSEIDLRARRLLQHIASGRALGTDVRRECLLLDAELRDSIRAPNLNQPRVTRAARTARQRGIEVVLLDDRGQPLPPDAEPTVLDAVASTLEDAQDGTVTVRLLPPERPTVATILAAAADHYQHIEIDAGGATQTWS